MGKARSCGKASSWKHLSAGAHGRLGLFYDFKGERDCPRWADQLAVLAPVAVGFGVHGDGVIPTDKETAVCADRYAQPAVVAFFSVEFRYVTHFWSTQWQSTLRRRMRYVTFVSDTLSHHLRQLCLVADDDAVALQPDDAAFLQRLERAPDDLPGGACHGGYLLLSKTGARV